VIRPGGRVRGLVAVVPNEVVNGIRLRYEVTGSGVPLVLVHGSWGDHHNWDALVPLLAHEFQVVAFDRRGHSDSESPAGQGSVNDDVADLAALIERLGDGPAHVVGNSFGASIALRLAARDPGLVRTLTAHEPPLLLLLVDDPAAASVVSEVGARIGAVAGLLSAGQNTAAAQQFVEQVALGPGQWESLPPHVQQTFIRNAATFLDEINDPEGLTIDVASLANFSGPALLTQGTESPPFFGLILDKIGAALDGAQRQTIDGAGHVPQMSHPKEYAEAVISFTRRSAG
jgi:pimeloyl-ACP methyl ester carboxylesterase